MWTDAINDIFSGNFLIGLFKILMGVLVTIVNVILYPFGLLIAQFMPALDEGLSLLAQYFDYATTVLSWVINAFAIPKLAISLMASYYLFAFSTTFGAWTIKLIIRWKQAIWG